MKRCILAMLALSLAMPLLAKTGSGNSATSPEAAPASDPKAATPAPAPDDAKPAEDPEHPTAIHYKGVTLTPVAFLVGELIYRSHNENADVASTYANIPFDGTANAALSEFRMSARQSRFGLLAEGKVKDYKLQGYFEMDFLGAAPTANEVESSSFNPRQRQLWARVETDGGFSFQGGQSWSLLAMNRVGITPRQEFIPLTIDGQYVVGYNWTRQSNFRLTQDINHKVWLAISLENPEQTLNASGAPANLFGFANSVNAQTPSSLITTSTTPGANGISTDAAPDVIGKIAFEPGWGHFEVKGVASFFRDRIGGVTNSKTGGGGGVGVILPFADKKVKLIGEFLAGSGIGRYASGQAADLTVDPTGQLEPIKSFHTMGGLEIAPSKDVDIYIYGGYEKQDQLSFVSSAGKGVGYGSPLVDNSGCMVEVPNPAPVAPATTPAAQGCGAQNKTLYQFQPGFWYKFYQGPAGRGQFGASYSYTYREAFPGKEGITPKASENMLMVSFRFYLP